MILLKSHSEIFTSYLRFSVSIIKYRNAFIYYSVIYFFSFLLFCYLLFSVIYLFSILVIYYFQLFIILILFLFIFLLKIHIFIQAQPRVSDSTIFTILKIGFIFKLEICEKKIMKQIQSIGRLHLSHLVQLKNN